MFKKKTSTYFGRERDENKEQKTRPEYQLNECKRRYLSKSKHQQVSLKLQFPDKMATRKRMAEIHKPGCFATLADGQN